MYSITLKTGYFEFYKDSQLLFTHPMGIEVIANGDTEVEFQLINDRKYRFPYDQISGYVGSNATDVAKLIAVDVGKYDTSGGGGGGNVTIDGPLTTISPALEIAPLGDAVQVAGIVGIANPAGSAWIDVLQEQTFSDAVGTKVVQPTGDISTMNSNASDNTTALDAVQWTVIGGLKSIASLIGVTATKTVSFLLNSMEVSLTSILGKFTDGNQRTKITDGTTNVSLTGTSLNVYDKALAGSIDPFSAIKVATPTVQISLKHTADKLPTLIDEVLSGTATSTFTSATCSVGYAVPAAGDTVIRKTFQSGNYQPGKALKIDLTFFDFAPVSTATKRIGYFSTATTSPYAPLDGIVLESSGTTVNLSIYRNGTAIASVNQSAWNDPLNGSGASGITIDWSKNQLVSFEVAWLGVGGVLFKLMGPDGKWYEIHRIIYTNSATTGAFMKPNLPITWFIRNTSAGVSTATFSSICAEVSTLGNLDKEGRSVSVPPNNTAMSAAATASVYPTLAIRLAAAGITAGDRYEIRGFDHINTNNDSAKIYVLRNPTLSGVLAYSTATNTNLEYAQNTLGLITVTSLNDVLYSATCNGSNNVKIWQDIQQTLGSKIAGTADVFVIAVQSYTVNLTCHSSFNLILY